MPGKDKKQAKQRNLLEEFEIINRDDIPEEGRRSIPALRRSGSNEWNLQAPVEGIQPGANGAMQEAQNNPVGPAPQNEVPPAENNNQMIRADGDAALQEELAERQEMYRQFAAEHNPDPNHAFVPQQTARHGWSKASEINHYALRGVGHSLNVVLPIIGVGATFGQAVMKPLRHNAVKEATQADRTHTMIPGWGGDTFDRDADILEDFRRVPTVWSYLTAGKAADAQGRDIPPKVTVYVEQPKTGSSRSLYGTAMGHTMLGIEYTRHSKITGRKERYNIKYGFYPAGGTTRTSNSLMMLRGAVVPGQLVDDSDHGYDISKSYTASRRQIEDIAKASEKYTEQGGYGYYTRNCTTFVRDMFRVGRIPENIIDSIFTEEKVRFDARANAGFVLANGMNTYLDTNAHRNLAKLAQSEDQSYQGWGNKRMTQADFQRYRDSRGSAGLGVKSLAPASAGENMRRMTDEGGQLGAYRYIPASMQRNPKDEAPNVRVSVVGIGRILSAASLSLSEKIRGILTDEQQLLAGFDWWLWDQELVEGDFGLADLVNEYETAKAGMPEQQAAQATAENTLKPDSVKKAHEKISDTIALTSRIYQTVLGSDSRFNTEVMNFLSLLQATVVSLNAIYQKQKKYSGGDAIEKLREEMMSSQYMVKAGGESVPMTPSHYESYLQIYKTPEEAVRAYKRLHELEDKRKGDDDNLKTWYSNKELAEYRRLVRNELLAQEFDKSHRYMLNKEEFSQKDIDYVFRLRSKEIKGTIETQGGSMYTTFSLASTTYMALIFDKIYGGIQDAVRGIPVVDPRKPGAGARASATWLSAWLAQKTSARFGEVKMIIRGIKRVFTRPESAKVKEAFHHFLLHAFLEKAVDSKQENRYGDFGRNIAFYYNFMLGFGGNRPMFFSNVIDALIQEVMEER